MWMTDTKGFQPGGACPICNKGTLEFEREPMSNRVRIFCSKCGLDPRVEGNYTAREATAERVLAMPPTNHAYVFQNVESPITKRLLELASLAEGKHKEYGATYDTYGPVMVALFPDGISFVNPDEWNKIGVVNMIVHKLMRYAENMHKGGHKDSADDIAVYGAILSELTK